MIFLKKLKKKKKIMKKLLYLPFSTLLILLFTTGCSPMTTQYKVTVDAITAPNLSVAPTTSIQ